jgi:hypothetical protein
VTNLAAVAAFAIMALVAGFQLALAAGAPLGGIAWGGKREGRLPAGLRIASALAAPILLLFGWIVLARAGVVDPSPLPEGLLAPATWGIAALLALNTLANITSRSRLERAIFGSATAVAAVLCAVVALNGRGG